METSNKRLKKLFSQIPEEKMFPIYERHGIEPQEGPNDLVDEIRLDGSNTITSLFRGWEGVDYDEIVRDVASKMDVPYADTEDERKIETRLLEKLIEKYLKNASPEERENVKEILGEAGEEYMGNPRHLLEGGLLGFLISNVGRQVTAQIVERIVLYIMARQGVKQAGKAAAQIAGFAVPILNIVLATWTVIDVAGPAFRKTVPTVLEVALYRLQYETE